jgi:hypothetical protein
MMLVLRKRKKERRGEAANLYERLRLMKIVNVSQRIILDNIGISSDLWGHNTNTCSSQPNSATCTWYFSSRLKFSVSSLSLSPISLPCSQLYQHCRTQSSVIPLNLHQQKNNYVWAEWLRQSGCRPSESSETSWWRLTPRLASIPRVALHIALQSQFHHLLSLYQSPIVNEHSGVEVQLWIYVGKGSLGTRLHWDCNVMGDAATTSPCLPSTCT